MNYEQQPPREPNEPAAADDQSHGPGWDPTAQVGDIYHIDLEPGTDPEIEKLAPDRPRICVGSWLDYNNGILYGDWIDAARPSDEVWADITAMLANPPTATKYGEKAEDWGIFDADNFGPLRVGENETVDWVTAVARGIAEHGPAFAAWADVMRDEESLDGFGDNYLGAWDSLEAYAENYVDEFGYNRVLNENLPDYIRRYVDINVAGMAQDMWLGGEVYVCQREGGGIYLFRS